MTRTASFLDGKSRDENAGTPMNNTKSGLSGSVSAVADQSMFIQLTR
jgi:hypothetical protein